MALPGSPQQAAEGRQETQARDDDGHRRDEAAPAALDAHDALPVEGHEDERSQKDRVGQDGDRPELRSRRLDAWLPLAHQRTHDRAGQHCNATDQHGLGGQERARPRTHEKGGNKVAHDEGSDAQHDPASMPELGPSDEIDAAAADFDLTDAMPTAALLGGGQHALAIDDGHVVG